MVRLDGLGFQDEVIRAEASWAWRSFYVSWGGVASSKRSVLCWVPEDLEDLQVRTFSPQGERRGSSTATGQYLTGAKNWSTGHFFGQSADTM